MINADTKYMSLALGLARRGLGRVWPNPAVGAVLVRDGAVVARGWTMPGGRPHAEAVALESAGALAAGATLYVTLEPCAHEGRGLPCADAIVAAGLARVVCAMEDPDPRVDGRGLDRLRAAGIAVETGVGVDEARWIALGHILRVTRTRPFVQLKLAVGADGLMATGQGRPVWVTGEGARARAHLLRARADAILVGRGTVEADDPELTCRLPGLESRSPVRVVLDSALRVPCSARLFKDAADNPVWMLASEAADPAKVAQFEKAGAVVLRVQAAAEGTVDLKAALAALAGRGITRLLVEGGPRVAGSFLEAGLVDEAVIFTGAEAVGAEGIRPLFDSGLDRLTESGAFTLHEERSVGSDMMRVYRPKD